jgi:hypothetical protein
MEIINKSDFTQLFLLSKIFNQVYTCGIGQLLKTQYDNESFRVIYYLVMH